MHHSILVSCQPKQSSPRTHQSLAFCTSSLAAILNVLSHTTQTMAHEQHHVGSASKFYEVPITSMSHAIRSVFSDSHRKYESIDFTLEKANNSACQCPARGQRSRKTEYWAILGSSALLSLLAVLLLILVGLDTLAHAGKFNIDSTSGQAMAITAAPVSSLAAPPTPWLSCGNSTAAALAAGCVFDQMLSTWLHPHCASPSLLATTLAAEKYTFFEDEALTVAIPDEDARNGRYPAHYVYARPDFHAKHCAYMWHRQVEAWVGGGWIDNESWQVKHTDHCIMTMLERNNPYQYTNARIRVAFTTCGRPWLQ